MNKRKVQQCSQSGIHFHHQYVYKLEVLEDQALQLCDESLKLRVYHY